MPATPSRARWRPGSAVSDNFALRAAGSTGFRAPSIGQSSLRRAATVFRDGRLQESLTLPPTDPVAMLKGGRQLNPEESVNFSLGAAFALGPVNVTLDWFRITVDGRIVLTEQDLSAENRAELLAANVVGAETVTAVAFFVNDIDTETTGLDLVADTAFDLAGGRVDVTLAWNVTDTRILERGATLSDRGVRELEDGLPESRGTLALDYTRGAWNALLRWRYYGELYEHLFNCESCWIETGAMVAVDAELVLGRHRPLHGDPRHQECERPTTGPASLRRGSRLPRSGLPAQPSRGVQRRQLLPAFEQRPVVARYGWPIRACCHDPLRTASGVSDHLTHLDVTAS